jgi:hypothetical protein
VRLARHHRAWLHARADAYEVVWATAWGPDANRLLCPFFGLPDFEFVRFPPTPFDPAEKVAAIERVAGDRRAARVDDTVTSAGREWTARRRHPTLLVEVDSAIGLTRARVDRLLDWARTGSKLTD